MKTRRRVICTYCNQPARLVTGDKVYPHLPTLFVRRYWMCAPCKAWVGVHKNSPDAPMGTIANRELRMARMNAHQAFDRLWKKHGMPRTMAYAILSGMMGIRKKDCHIGFFNIEQCERVVAICSAKIKGGPSCPNTNSSSATASRTQAN